MADNTTLNAGSGGDVIATDDVSGVKYQRVKLVDGALDSTTAIAAGGGTEAGALRVTVASDSTGLLPVNSELPAAAALADGASNPTAPAVGAAGLLYNGTTWDRARGDTTSGAWVNIKAGSITSAGSDSTPSVHRTVKGVTATLTSVNDSASSGTILASNSNRLGCVIVNDSTSILYLRLSSSAAAIAAGSYNYKLQPDDTLELPSAGGPLYTGAITGIWSADASGWAAVTEYT